MAIAYLFDGTFELFRCYFPAPSHINQKGEEVGAARVYLASMVRFLRETRPTYVGAAFDTVIESFRNELFDDYKTGEGLEPELFGQFPMVEDITEALGIRTWRMQEFEADDGLATAAVALAAEDAIREVLIYSPDKDLFQLVHRPKIRSYDRLRDKFYDPPAVQAKLGIAPHLVPDYLALVGDTADGIPGLKGWGAKSTATVLSAFDGIDAIPDDPELWPAVRGKKKLAEELANRREDAALYKELATLRIDAPIATTLADVKWSGQLDGEALSKVCGRLEVDVPSI